MLLLDSLMVVSMASMLYAAMPLEGTADRLLNADAAC